MIHKIVIHTFRKISGTILLISALLLPLADIFKATQLEATEQTKQVKLMQL
jgi:hypothetical protein